MTVRRNVHAWLPIAFVAAGAAAFLAVGSLAGPDPAPRLSSTVSAKLASGLVASVTDGDTIRMADYRRIRLVQIDAPEVAKGECYGAEATRTLERLLPAGTKVDIVTDRALDSRDRFGRVLAYVLKGGENINLRLVELGAAAPYFYRGDRGRLAAQLLSAARRAKSARRGLWGACPETKLDPEHAIDARP